MPVRCRQPAARSAAFRHRSQSLCGFDSSTCQCDPSLLSLHLTADNTWLLLESAIHEINNHNASGLSFEELYRCGRCLCRV